MTEKSERVNVRALRWKKQSRNEWSNPHNTLHMAWAEDGFYTATDYGNGKFSACFTYAGHAGQRGFFIPDASTLAKSLTEAKPRCAEHFAKKKALVESVRRHVEAMLENTEWRPLEDGGLGLFN
jgi:hypothetical protein